MVSIPSWMLDQNGLSVGDDVVMENSVVKGMIQFRKWDGPEKERDYALEDAKREHLSG